MSSESKQNDKFINGSIVIYDINGINWKMILRKLARRQITVAPKLLKAGSETINIKGKLTFEILLFISLIFTMTVPSFKSVLIL